MKRRTFVTCLGSAVAAWPLAAPPQQANMRAIGYLYIGAPEPSAHLAAAFRAGLMETGRRSDLATWVGAAFMSYAAIVYPLIGIATRHHFPEIPMFGVTPCPVTIFTFGLLQLTVRPVPRWLLVVPFVWSLIRGSAAILLNVPQDWLLLVNGCIAVPLIVFRDRQAMQDVPA
jgi:Family of unknown function (DUF6064)